MGQLALIYRHNERKNTTYSNMNIDLAQTQNNVHYKKCNSTYNERLKEIIDTGDDGKQDIENFNSVVLEGLKTLENDYIGGGGSRGNGQIAFKDLKDENGKLIEL